MPPHALTISRSHADCAVAPRARNARRDSNDMVAVRIAYSETNLR